MVVKKLLGSRLFSQKISEMATIEGVIKQPILFVHPESDTKHAFYGCPAGWTWPD